MQKLFLVCVCLLLSIPCQADIIVEFPLNTEPNWVTEGQWEFGVPTGDGGPQSYDPTSGHTGSNVYGYNLSGNYENNIPEYCLTTSALDCTLAENVTLSFWRWLGVEESTFDHAKIKVSNDRTNWTEVWANGSSIIADSSWIYCEYNISAVADGEPNVYVCWCMGPTDFSEAYAGWNIDDISLLGDLLDPLFITPDANFVSFGPVGGQFSPDCNSYTLTNKGDSEINWTATATKSWLDIIPDSGVLAPDDSVVVQICINSDANMLADGKYTDTVAFTNIDTGFSQLISVTLYVGDNIFVPLQFPTIQSAIDAATDGDTIVVLDGTYTGDGNRDIDFHGKAIILKSVNGPEHCIIDTQGTEENPHRGFYFSNESRKTIIKGFTITEGYAPGGVGGGIYCVNSSPEIMNCYVTNNSASNWGGGILCIDSSAVITNCVVGSNSAVNGGGMKLRGPVTLNNCLIINNSAVRTPEGYYGYGGGLSCEGSVTVKNCTITNNFAEGEYGGVICFYPVLAQLINCIVWGNTKEDLRDEIATFSCVGTGNTSGTGNISEDPQFVRGPLGDYYLSQIAGGQTSDSNCVDSGSDLAAEFGMNSLTTCTTNIFDNGTVDMGYHYPIPGSPQHDECPNAISIEEGSTYHGSNDYATGAYFSSCGSNDSIDVWYSYTATNDGYHNFSLCGSTFDTTLSIYDSCVGTELACNNDACGFQSKIAFYLIAGNTYFIRVSGNNGEAGVYSFTLSKPKCLGEIPGDLTGDCKISFADFALMTGDWLECNLDPPEACWE